MGRSSKVRNHHSYTQCDSCLRRVPIIHINRHRAQCSAELDRFSYRFQNSTIEFVDKTKNSLHHGRGGKIMYRGTTNASIDTSSVSQFTNHTTTENLVGLREYNINRTLSLRNEQEHDTDPYFIFLYFWFL